ncbi:histidine phosphatase family protein [Glaciimonas immobilis]|uniref:Broad specificity phosphatase PhoE n=1 Tax=Glaciimonas immobilis TaxID=728004 RepID=A0A840S148_9BURK|nr:histidine phosphatase family protein [Glaciimonas immobilis]KAF3996243.1 histidine phosphatase family protein [Glaciimonas immobilis]MBB5202350.1 broad specificity phosphatase PhoE [Glaciimonas immobilis]
MAEFFMVRHGQASFGTDNYDRLSATGAQQSRWLGDYFAERKINFDQIFTGNMQRHAETADAICEGLGHNPDRIIHPGLNEYDFLGLFDALGPGQAITKGMAWTDKATFYRELKRVLRLWITGELPNAPETWAAFRARVTEAYSAIAQSGACRVLVVSSGGPIGMLTAHTLEAPDAMAIELNMQIKNTSVTHFYFNQQSVRLASFNQVTHLDRPDRLGAITFG